MVTSAALIMVAVGTDTIMTMNWRMPVLSCGEVDLPAVSWIAGSYWVLGPPAAGVAGCRCTAGNWLRSCLRGSALFPGVSFGEGLDRDLVHLERPGGTGIGLQMDEQVDDLVLADAAVKSDPELPAEGLTRSECRCDGD